MEVKMTKNRLESYRSEKEEINELNKKLGSLMEESYYGYSMINDYRTGYPRPQAVTGTDITAYRVQRSRLMEAISRLESRCAEVEKWIESITDSTTRRIFRMYYIDGMNQNKIARRLHMDQSRISRRIADHLGK